MLKYGSLVSVSNSNAKSLMSKNLTNRQQDMFKTTVPPSTIIAALNAAGGVSFPNVSNISASNADFANSRISTLYVDLIKQKTTSKPNITINNPLLITDLTNVTDQTYGYFVGKDSNFQGNSLNIDVGNVQFRDNVIQINSSYFSNFPTPTSSNKTKYDSILSGFLFPNTNDDDNKKLFNSMLIIPSKYYLDDASRQFKQYDDTLNTDCFGSGNNEYTNSIRFTSTDYGFNNNSTYVDPANQIRPSDSKLFSINDCNNLLNIEANNLALYGGKIISINSTSFNPDISNSGIGTIEFLIYNNHVHPVLISEFSQDMITFKPPVEMESQLNLLSNLRFDNIGQIQIKDASSFSIADFSNNILWRIDSSGNLIFPNINPIIEFSGSLNLTSSPNQSIDINPLVIYDIQTCSELKYLANIQVNALDVSTNIFFRNILLDASQNNTFTGKIISKDENRKIMSMTFQGYTMWESSVNTVTYIINQVISPNPAWSIIQMEIVNSVDLRINLSNPQTTTTSWNISIESISI